MSLWRTVGRRLVAVALTVSIGGFLSATLVRYSPGFGADERQMDARLSRQSIETIRSASDQEKNIVSYYLKSMRGIFLGDLGTSQSLHQPVRNLLAERSTVTLRMVGTSLFMAWAAAIVLVIVSWLLDSAVIDQICRIAGGLLLCVPAGAIALFVILLDSSACLALALVVFPKVHRYLADLVSSASEMPHILAAKAKGLSGSQILLWHVLPVIHREVLALAGVSMALALSAAIPVEALCGVLGIGQLAWQSALARDLPVLVYVAVLVITCTVLANSGAELLMDERKGALMKTLRTIASTIAALLVLLSFVGSLS